MPSWNSINGGNEECTGKGNWRAESKSTVDSMVDWMVRALDVDWMVRALDVDWMVRALDVDWMV